MLIVHKTLVSQGIFIPGFCSIGSAGQWVERQIIHGVDTDLQTDTVLYL